MIVALKIKYDISKISISLIKDISNIKIGIKEFIIDYNVRFTNIHDAIEKNCRPDTATYFDWYMDGLDANMKCVLEDTTLANLNNAKRID